MIQEAINRGLGSVAAAATAGKFMSDKAAANTLEAVSRQNEMIDRSQALGAEASDIVAKDALNKDAQTQELQNQAMISEKMESNYQARDARGRFQTKAATKAILTHDMTKSQEALENLRQQQMQIQAQKQSWLYKTDSYNRVEDVYRKNSKDYLLAKSKYERVDLSKTLTPQQLDAVDMLKKGAK